ncbi:uncharacterized protein At1g24485-like [Benincasa hispida]|uniref:uncharacterized protein At1g24485-like n=1 Tax=Benincasa hispida TaxID=102211 RepID=UPI0018FF1647|nr:uncharacterized protein At1g24485-like [Benincasa hispida]
MDTLRSFPSSASKQNCYKLPIFKQKLRYLVKSGFLYGDYDALNRPPTFDLHIDGKKLSTIKISAAEEMIIDELVYASKESGAMNLCFVEKKDSGVPFVSSIQVVPADGGLYSKMQLNETFRLVARLNFGENQKWARKFSIDDKYERLWTSTTPANCNIVSTNIDYNSPENNPPRFVMENAIESDVVSSPIILTVDLPQSSSQPQSTYFVFYFTEKLMGFSNHSRTMNILINGQKMSTVTTDPNKCTVITLYPVSVIGSTVNVTLASASSTDLPPLINAMEVFSRISMGGDSGGIGGSDPTVHFNYMSFVLMFSAYVLVFTTLLS